MLFRVSVFLMVLLAGGPVLAQSLRLDQAKRALANSDLKYLAGKVRAEGFPCRRADKGVFLGQGQRGRRFRITCDGDKFTYRIEQLDQKRFDIEFDR